MSKIKPVGKNKDTFVMQSTTTANKNFEQVNSNFLQGTRSSMSRLTKVQSARGSLPAAQTITLKPSQTVASGLNSRSSSRMAAAFLNAATTLRSRGNSNGSGTSSRLRMANASSVSRSNAYALKPSQTFDSVPS